MAKKERRTIKMFLLWKITERGEKNLLQETVFTYVMNVLLCVMKFLKRKDLTALKV